MKNLLKKLSEQKITVGSIESMTGGLFAAKICEVPGASKVFKGSIVTYVTSIKSDVVGVSKNTIKKYGVVSKEVAKEMAQKGLKLLRVDRCVSVTGNAGPTAEPGGQPVGRFYIAVASPKRTVVKEFDVTGKRNKIRNKAVLAMRDMLY